MTTLQVVLPDLDSTNVSLAMATAFASITATTCGIPPLHTPAPTDSPRPSTGQEHTLPRPKAEGRLDYHRRILVALYHAVCAAWDWLALNDHSSERIPKPGSEAVKTWGIMQLSCMHAAQSAAQACSHAHDKSNAADSGEQSRPCATSSVEAQAGMPQASPGSTYTEGYHTPSARADGRDATLAGASAMVRRSSASARAAAAAVFTSQALSVALAAIPAPPAQAPEGPAAAAQPSAGEESPDDTAPTVTFRSVLDTAIQGCVGGQQSKPEGSAAEAGAAGTVEEERQGHLARVADAVPLLLLGLSALMLLRGEGCADAPAAGDARLLTCVRTAAGHDQADLVESMHWLCQHCSGSDQDSKVQACMHTLDSDLKQLHLQLEPHEGVRDQGWNALDAVLHSHRCLHQALRSQVRCFVSRCDNAILTM